VKRLERPLLKLALQDTNFPNSPNHPARQVLNLIEQYAVAADDQGKFFDAKLQRFLYLLVDRVCSRAGEDPGIFEMVRDSLEKVLLPILQIRRTRVARLQEACEGRESIRSARARVNAALERVWRDARCPPCCCACWMQAGASISCCWKCVRGRRARPGRQGWRCWTGCSRGSAPIWRYRGPGGRRRPC
jgi:hypothetical protein